MFRKKKTMLLICAAGLAISLVTLIFNPPARIDAAISTIIFAALGFTFYNSKKLL